jgi:hypothetical protein
MTGKQFEVIVELLQKIYIELYNSNNSLKTRRPVRSKKF